MEPTAIGKKLSGEVAWSGVVLFFSPLFLLCRFGGYSTIFNRLFQYTA
jgi:hypothetical protein